MYSEDNVQRECMLRHWSWAKSMSSGTVNISIYHNIFQMISIYLNLSHIVQLVLIGLNSIPISTNIAKYCNILQNIAKYCKATWLFRSQKKMLQFSMHGQHMVAWPIWIWACHQTESHSWVSWPVLGLRCIWVERTFAEHLRNFNGLLGTLGWKLEAQKLNSLANKTMETHYIIIYYIILYHIILYNIISHNII